MNMKTIANSSSKEKMRIVSLCLVNYFDVPKIFTYIANNHHKRQLNFDSGPDEELKGTEQPATKRKRKLIQKPQIKVLYNYLVHSLYCYMKNK